MIRVRYAPSPTGQLHVGSLRAVLFNWLFARHHQGQFLLRIEDTDQVRSLPEHTTAILATLAWMGLDHDGPLVIQSQRTALYQRYLQQLVAAQKAYYCDCQVAPEQLVESNYRFYDQRCRTRNLTQGAIRFKLPADLNDIGWVDLIHGAITFDLAQLDDFVIARADGTPMYNFAVVVDDYEMQISHVLRGDEHINNTPKQLLLYAALGQPAPQFAHIPLILGPDGRKLSKREAATAVEDYRQQGFLADALFNYLVRLGWSHGDQEIFTRSELINYFSLAQVGKSGAIFDVTKLTWMNTVYLKQTPAAELLHLIQRDLDPAYQQQFNTLNTPQILDLLTLYKPRVNVLTELAAAVLALDRAPGSYDSVALTQWITVQTGPALVQLHAALAALSDWSAASILAVIKQVGAAQQLSLPQLAQPLRLALLGQTTSPSIAELLSCLPKALVLERLQQFQHNLV